MTTVCAPKKFSTFKYTRFNLVARNYLVVTKSAREIVTAVENKLALDWQFVSRVWKAIAA